MSKKATELQKKEMSKMYRGKEIFKPLNTGWIDENVACVREWVANIFFCRKGDTTIMIDAGYNYERLRKLPLSFFGKRDLADLTSTIMADCEVLEKTCSHYIPGLFVSIISTVLIALSLFAFDWRMALAALWVIPVSIAALLASYKVQDRVQAKTMTVKMTCADGIQEYIETIRDLNQGCDIVFDHVGFAYNSGETVLKDVSFTAKQGEVTALVGPSDGGKTTVSRLAARFWDHQQGSITVGGMDISKVDPEKLMGLYSIVFQDVTLFDNSILENIRLGRKDALYAQNGIYTHMVQFQTGSQNWAI